ncbi:hypothetical protein BDV25DRAFT_139982 [Aspergillus avenaceus]|uniref:Uncharacterized protein n=1 Tax=Aspergillus avenaceus TaxID=36643 RepID=A0A5N6TW10_ASPAV|nr:hypothetical protein BDV25DRAFT_139982 [Aspergillus avenaceus]
MEWAVDPGPVSVSEGLGLSWQMHPPRLQNVPWSEEFRHLLPWSWIMKEHVVSTWVKHSWTRGNNARDGTRLGNTLGIVSAPCSN